MHHLSYLAVCAAIIGILLPPQGILADGPGLELYQDRLILQIVPSAEAVALAHKRNMDIWNEGSNMLEVMATAADADALRAANASFSILHTNLEGALTGEINRLGLDHPSAPISFFRTPDNKKKPVSALSVAYFDDFRPIEDVMEWIAAFAKAHPDHVHLVPSIGTSSQGRDIPALHITHGPDPPKGKKRVYIQSLLHAREWAGLTSTQWTMSKIVAKAIQGDPTILSLLATVEFVFIPLSNPDGYLHTWKKDRLWRKNRRGVVAGTVGVDLNRNWPNHWGTDGASSNPEDETYRGNKPGSEPETQALMSYYAALPNIIAAVDIHTFSEIILFPPGWTMKVSKDAAAFEAMGDVMRRAIQAVRGTIYKPERINEFYLAAGSSVDWWYDTEGVQRVGHPRPYTLAFELSPPPMTRGSNGTIGFIVAPTLIKPIGEDLYAGVLALTRQALAHPLPIVTENTVST